MSTKVYNGYRIRGVTTIDEAFRLLNTDENREWVAERVTQYVREYLAVRVSRVIDRAYLEPDDPERAKAADFAVTRCLRDLWKEQREAKAEQRRDHVIDFDFELSLIPVGEKGQRKHVMALLFAEQDKFRQWFESLDCVEEFSYWDNTDRPDDITAAQWNRRRDLWARALPGMKTPSQAGLTLQFHPPVPPMPTSREELRPLIADVPKRALYHANDHVMGMALKKLQMGMDEKKRTDNFWEHWRKAGEYKESDAGKAEIARIAAHYETVLPDFQTLEF